MRQSVRDLARTVFVRLARLYCLGDPNVRGQLRTLHTLKALRGRRYYDVADAGCGRSGALGWLNGIAFIAFPISRLHRESGVTGFDLDPTVVEANVRAAAHAGATNLFFEVADLFHLGDGRRFDAVVFSDIARDLRRDADFVRTVTRLVRPSGRFVMICPSRRQLMRRSRFERRAIDSGFTTEDLQELVASCGLRLESIRPIVGPIAGRMALLGKRAAEIHYMLLVFLFPFLMSVATMDLFAIPREGDAFLVIAGRPEAS